MNCPYCRKTSRGSEIPKAFGEMSQESREHRFMRWTKDCRCSGKITNLNRSHRNKGGIKSMKPETKSAGRRKLWWIKERHNPQLGVYYVACGQMWKKDAMGHERSLYGNNVMLSFDSGADYQAKIDALEKAGRRVL